ncbi:MAG: hypothetical protein OXH83_14865 [Bryobacterales bacterium]|nr:hypothetical protein [Bryobacterales bacterium]
MARTNLGWTNPTDSPMSNAGTFRQHSCHALEVIWGAVLSIGYVALELM